MSGKRERNEAASGQHPAGDVSRHDRDAETDLQGTRVSGSSAPVWSQAANRSLSPLELADELERLLKIADDGTRSAKATHEEAALLISLRLNAPLLIAALRLAENIYHGWDKTHDLAAYRATREPKP